MKTITIECNTGEDKGGFEVTIIYNSNRIVSKYFRSIHDAIDWISTFKHPFEN